MKYSIQIKFRNDPDVDSVWRNNDVEKDSLLYLANIKEAHTLITIWYRWRIAVQRE